MGFWQNLGKWLMAVVSTSDRPSPSPVTEPTRNRVSSALTEEYLQVLQAVLKAEVECNGDPQVVYMVLAQHQDKLDFTFADILTRRFESALDPKNSERNQFLATILNNFAIDIHEFFLGKRADNLEIALEIAIAAYEGALQVRTREAFPQDWAQTQNNLGVLYYDRIRGERAENIELAIAACEGALQVYTADAFPQQWAGTQTNLGIAYNHRIRGERAENVEKAILHHEKALQVYTADAFPQQWAASQNNLGNAYINRIRGERSENLEDAIAAYEAALQVRTPEAFPQQWAMTQNNLGAAYWDRIRGERADNLELAIAAFQTALQVCTPEAFPQENASTLFNLGVAYRDANQLEQARDTFAEAINTVELLRGEIRSGDEVKRNLNEEWNKLFRRAIEVCIELKDYDRAIEYADRSKARNLVELMAVRDVYPKGEIPEDDRRRLQELRRQIDEENRRLAADPNPDYSQIAQLRQEYRHKFPYEPLTYEQIQTLTGDNTAIIEWYILFDTFVAFVVLPDRGDAPLYFWQSSPEDLQNLSDWRNDYLQTYLTNRKGWRTDLAAKLPRLAEILHLDELLANIPETCDKLVLVPHRYLHLFPLHALPVKSGESCLLNAFPGGVSYAPNCQLLKVARSKQNREFRSLFAIQNPTGDLAYTDIEVQNIRQLFDPQRVFARDAATKEAIFPHLKDDNPTVAHCAHFSCHGYFNFNNPLLSALLLADAELPPPPPEPDPERYLPLKDDRTLDLQKCLTLTDIFELDLSQCRLVTLSACETGVTDFTSTSDEYIGLPNGFLLAGAPNVVSSLWTVSDISTSLLMLKFYQNLKASAGKDVTIALNQAQTWLRDATTPQLKTWVSSLKLEDDDRRTIDNSLTYFGDDERPFENPLYWAAFCAIGQ